MDPWAQPAHDGVAPNRAAKLGEIVGCPKNENDWSQMINCLRRVDAADITKAFYDFFVSIFNKNLVHYHTLVYVEIVDI